MVFSQAGLIPNPVDILLRRTPLLVYPRSQVAESDDGSQPPHITYKGHGRHNPSVCPTGLSSGLSYTPNLLQVARRLATPNICYVGHCMPKAIFMGRRRHFTDVLPYCALPVVNVQRYSQTLILIIADISSLRKCPQWVRSRPFVGRPFVD